MTNTTHTIFTTTRVTRTGKPMAGTFERKFRAIDEAMAAELAASNSMTRAEYAAASSSRSENGVWTFTPATGSPVHIQVSAITENTSR